MKTKHIILIAVAGIVGIGVSKTLSHRKPSFQRFMTKDGLFWFIPSFGYAGDK